jgi:hypothetical protein
MKAKSPLAEATAGALTLVGRFLPKQSCDNLLFPAHFAGASWIAPWRFHSPRLECHVQHEESA